MMMRTEVIKDLNIRCLLFRRKIGEISLFKKKKNTTLIFQTFVKFVIFLNEESF